jgi:hypothetical protein
MVTAPQAGQESFTALSPGAIFLPQEIQEGMSISYYQAYSRLFKG